MKKQKNSFKIDYNLIIVSFIICSFLFLGFYLSNISVARSKITQQDLIFSQGLVTSIIDGDTINVQGESVRLLGINAPEKGQDCYLAARKRLEELVLDKRVELRIDSRDKDKYDRYLRYVYLNNENINIKMLKEGLARVLLMEDNVLYRQEIFEAQEYAKQNKIGCLWNPEIKETYNQLTSQKDIEWKILTKEKTGLEVIEACQAKNYLGKEIIIEGRITDTYRHGTTGIFLNIGEVYPNNCFTSVIWYDDWQNFPEDAHNFYYNKFTRIKGKIQEYNNKPQIILRNSEQIEAH